MKKMLIIAALTFSTQAFADPAGDNDLVVNFEYKATGVPNPMAALLYKDVTIAGDISYINRSGDVVPVCHFENVSFVANNPRVFCFNSTEYRAVVTFGNSLKEEVLFDFEIYRINDVKHSVSRGRIVKSANDATDISIGTIF